MEWVVEMLIRDQLLVTGDQPRLPATLYTTNRVLLLFVRDRKGGNEIA
jgi:hypothetical protein